MVYITKADGTTESFRESKLRESLKRAGAPDYVAEDIIEEVKANVLYDGISTHEIYKAAFALLKQKRLNPSAARYSVKRALLKLGPSGFPFEKFIAKVLMEIGYKNVRTGVELNGTCISHEVDVFAVDKNGKKIAAELKFHNSLGVKTDVKVAMYVNARQMDLRDVVDEMWLVTNTKFTSNAKKYGKCAGLFMMGWSYPNGFGLEALIDKAGVHPITALTTLSDHDKNKLLQNDIVLCKEMLGNAKILKSLGVSSKIDTVLQEAEAVVTGRDFIMKESAPADFNSFVS